MRRMIYLCFFLILIPFRSTLSQNLFARVVDVGAGLCVVIQMPNNMYMIYDAGNYIGGGSEAFDSITEIIPPGSEIELMVLSHSDADHLGAVDEICDAYRVKRIIRSGYRRSTGTWRDADAAIRAEKDSEGCIDINLSYFEFPPGATYRFNNVFVTMVCGFHKPPSDWNLSSNSGEYRNAGSVVIRIQYADKSILLCGDTVGRHIGDDEDACIAAEKYILDNSSVINIDSDIIVAPHHGADNASSLDFIEAVSPEYVIFSAGHKYDHPRAVTAKRYLSSGVNLSNIFRTDRGDDEGSDEWNHERISDHNDPIGDDDVDIVIKQNGDIEVRYKQ